MSGPIEVIPPAPLPAVQVLLPDGSVLTPEVTPVRPPIQVFPPGAGSGGGSPPVTEVAGAACLRGAPLYVSRAGGQAFPARADDHLSAFAVGLASADTAPGFPVDLLGGHVALDDWTAITGSRDLLKGQPYFVAPAGGLTTVPPARPTSVASALVGFALTPRVLDVRPLPPVLL